jgi:hypothetical protein
LLVPPDEEAIAVPAEPVAVVDATADESALIDEQPQAAAERFGRSMTLAYGIVNCQKSVPQELQMVVYFAD